MPFHRTEHSGFYEGGRKAHRKSGWSQKLHKQKFHNMTKFIPRDYLGLAGTILGVPGGPRGSQVDKYPKNGQISEIGGRKIGQIKKLQ